jgi:hypothetical protein
MAAASKTIDDWGESPPEPHGNGCRCEDCRLWESFYVEEFASYLVWQSWSQCETIL